MNGWRKRERWACGSDRSTVIERDLSATLSYQPSNSTSHIARSSKKEEEEEEQVAATEAPSSSGT